MAKTAAKQKTLRFTRSGGNIWKVSVDGQNLSFSGNTASKNVKPGDHTVQWFVRGTPGATYSIECTAPPEAKFKAGATFDNQGKDMGSAWVMVN